MLTGGAWAADPPTADTPNAETSVPASERPRLKLGPYGRAYTNPVSDAAASTLPRFESSVEVFGKAPPLEFNQTMAVWWDHFNISTGSLYGKGIPTYQTVNLIPLAEWLAKKVKEKKKPAP
jgi:hypothetical protein